jgi:DNA polymerase
MIERAVYDTETRSHCDIGRGLDVYMRHHTTQPVCATFVTPNWSANATFLPSIEGRDVLEAKMREAGLVVVPPESLVAMVRATKTLVAHNFAFDQLATEVLFGVHVPADQWSCTMARAMRIGLPGGLGNACEVLKFGEGGKDKEGNRLMKQISKPRPTWTKKHAAGEPLAACGPEWFEDADRLARTALYCFRDGGATAGLDKLLPELEPAERAIWLHVHDMNCRGIPLDLQLIHGAIKISEEAQRDVIDRIRHYTSGMVQSLKAPAQLTAWAARYGVAVDSWAKDDVVSYLANPQLPEAVRVICQARQEASRGSVAKYETAAEMVSADGRLRHQLLYSGTTPTMRLAGRGWQPLNLPRPKIEADKSAGLADIKAGRPVRVPEWKLRYDPEKALHAIRAGDLKTLREIGDPEEILSDNIRNSIESPKGKIIVSPDLSAIEARGVFWVASCQKALDAYRRDEDLYCQLASTMFGFPVNQKEHPEERQYGKVGILQCGYGSGAAKLAMANKLSEELAARIVQAYRQEEYPEVPRTWRELESAAVEAICHPGHMIPACGNRVHFLFDAGWLRICRPSGTWCYLPDAGIDTEGRIFYHAWIKGAWREESIWGGVLINFIVQGFCRELMYGAEMQMAQRPEYELFLQCYDSLSGLVDIDRAKELCDEMIRVMTTPPPWAHDMPLKAAGKPKLRYA